MTTKELYNRITLGTCVSGQFTVTIEYRGNEYTCKSNNTLAYDSIRFDPTQTRVTTHPSRHSWPCGMSAK